MIGSSVEVPFELGEDRVVGPAEVVGQHVEPPAVGHPDHDLAPAAGCRQLDQLVEHRDRHVQALDRELLLAQVRLVHEALERVDLGQPAQQRLLLVGPERLAEAVGLDRLAQPQALAVRGDVLDFVGDRPAVRFAQMRQRVQQRVALDVHAQDVGRELAHQLRSQAERLGVERGVALGLAAEGVELGGEVPVGAVRLEQRGGRLHRAQQPLVDDARRRGRGRRGSGRSRRSSRLGRRGQRRQRHPERLEHALVEAVLSAQVAPRSVPGSGPTRRPG